MNNSETSSKHRISKDIVTIKSVDISSTLWNEILLVLKNKNMFKNVSQNCYETAIGFYFQGRTFYNAAKYDNDYTFPLNLFYAFNNLIKVCIIMKEGPNSISSHGASFFNVCEHKQLNYDMFKISIHDDGVFGGLLKISPYKKYCTKEIPRSKNSFTELSFSAILKNLHYISPCSLSNDDYLKLCNTTFITPLFKDLILVEDLKPRCYNLNKIRIPSNFKPKTLDELKKKVGYCKVEELINYQKCLIHLETDNYGNFYLIPKVEVSEKQKCKNGNIETLSTKEVFFEQLALSYLITLSASSIVRYHGELWNTILRDKENIESSAFLILLKDFFYSIPLKVLNLLTNKIYILDN